SVSITNPIQNQSITFGQEILIQTNASDPENAIQKVEFFYGEQMVGIVTSAPFEISWKNAPVGNHILKAKIFDNEGMTAESSRIDISVIEEVAVNQAPSISITNPIQNQSFTFGQKILIQTNAFDPENKIQKVEFYIGEQMIGTVETPPYEVTWNNAPVGNHVLKAKIFDIEGLTAESDRINISVIDESPANQAPSVSIINPIQDQSFAFGEDILIRTNASDPENAIQKVEFFYGEQMIGIVNTAPYEVIWKNAPVGNHVLKAKIFDNEGLSAESARINIKVKTSPLRGGKIKIINPVNNQVFKSTDTIRIEVVKTEGDVKIDSVILYLDETQIEVSRKEPFKFEISDLKEGQRKLIAKAFKYGNLIESETIIVNIFTESYASTEISIQKPSKEVQPKEQFRFAIGPNPTDDILNVYMDELPRNQPVEIQLFDINGITLNSIQSNTDKEKISIELGSYPAGIYFIRIMGDHKTFGTKRIIKR
ncbi:Ig-like domain-containing protein, partial [Marivirga sp.]|uniref:T9SS type A sorting domain-containing protein n=1 Tax=Marivirga sp. TaxID=2018662 RepID=UPI0025E31B4B